MTQAQIIEQAVKAALRVALRPELKAAKAKAAVKQPFDAQAAINRAVKARGFQKPGVANVNVLTYGKWEAKGFKVIPGQKALKVGTLRLFHEEQVAPIAG